MLALERVAISLKKNSLQSVVEIYDGVFYKKQKKVINVDGINNKLTVIESELLHEEGVCEVIVYAKDNKIMASIYP